MKSVRVSKPPELTEAQREYYMGERRTLIARLGNVEDLLGLERSIIPRRKRKFLTDPPGDYIGDTHTG